MKRNLLTIIIGGVLIVIFALLLFVFQVRQSEVAVVTRFGRVDREKSEPGAYGRWPWPIENVYKLDQRIQNFQDALYETPTADYNNLLTSVYVGWRITDAKTFFPKFAGGSVTVAERMIKDVVTQAKVAVVGKYRLENFVNQNEKDLKFDAIEAEIKANAQAQLQANNWGISIEYLGLEKLGLPESVTTAVFERMTAERKLQADKLQFEGDARAQEIRSSAERQAAEVNSRANAEAFRIRGEGEAVAAKVLPVFQQNPELATFLLKTEALEGSLKERSILIFDQRTPPFDLFNGAVGKPAR
jgi:modulator of FtsH protease HflC